LLEAVIDIGRVPSYYVQAVSSAMGVVGAAKGAMEAGTFGPYRGTPKLICVQQDSCAPMVRAWQAGAEEIRDHDKVAAPTGVAKAILRGDPSAEYPIVRTHVAASGGTFVSVSEREIRRAQVLLYERERIWPCEAGACALAGYIKLLRRRHVPAENGPVLVNVTGGANERPRWSR
jgi:threonine synthase